MRVRAYEKYKSTSLFISQPRLPNCGGELQDEPMSGPTRPHKQPRQASLWKTLRWTLFFWIGGPFAALSLRLFAPQPEGPLWRVFEAGVLIYAVLGAGFLASCLLHQRQQSLRSGKAIRFESGEALAKLDGQGRITAVNCSFCSLLGTSPEKAAGRTLASFLSQGSFEQKEVASMVGAIRAGAEAHAELPLRLALKERGWVQASFFPQGGPGAAGGTLVLRDVTRLVESREEAQEAQRRLKMASALAGLAFWEQEAPRAPWSLSTDSPLSALLGSNPVSLLDRMSQQVLASRLEASWATGDGWEMMAKAVLADGETLFLAIQGRCARREGRVHRMTGLIQNVTERQTLLASLEQAVASDPLTKMMSRQAFLTAAAEAGRSLSGERGFAFLIVDLKGLAAVNRLQGSLAGDQMIQEAATRLSLAMEECQERGLFNKGSLACRSGGSSFYAAFFGVPLQGSGRAIAEALLLRLRPEGGEAEGPPDGLSLEPILSLVHLPHPPSRLDEVAAEAEGNLSQAAASSDRIASVCRMPGCRAARHAGSPDLPSDIRLSLQKGQLTVAYQPVMNLKEGFLTGLDAEVRWTHPILGEMSMRSFYSLALETGMAGPIGEWAMAEAFRQLMEWDARWPEVQMKRMGLRVSQREVEGPSWTQNLYREMARSPSLPGRLAVEIPLEDLMSLSRDGLSALDLARSAGVKVHALSRHLRSLPAVGLPQLPLDGLVLEKSVFQQRQGGVLDSCPSHWELAATGIETEGDEAACRTAGCTAGRGPLYGRHVSPGEMARHMASSSLNSTGRQPGWVA